MQRVMIIGSPGSGKSTLAVKLGEKTGLPVFHIDQIHHKPGWIERTQDERSALTLEVHAHESWIFEGGHSATYPQRIARADTCIWLDLPLGLRAWRIFIRTLKYYGKTRPDMPENCPERFNLDFTIWILTTWKKQRLESLALLKNAPAHVNTHHLRGVKDIDMFLNQIKP